MKTIRRFVSLVLLSLLLSTVNFTNVLAISTINNPSILSSITGINDPTTAPPSTSIAASSDEQLQLVNNKYSIISNGSSINNGSISSLIKTSGTYVSDPQVMWDASSNRFYFSVFENKGSTSPNEGVAWGYSKTADPKSPTDFCTFFNGFNYGSTSFPDRQSLGDSKSFLLIGSDRYSTSTGNLVGSDVAWISKPANGKTTCPLNPNLKSGIKNLSNSDGSFPYSPVPAKQIDSSDTSWVTATPNWYNASSLSLYKVTNNSGNAVVNPVQNLSVPTFSMPPSAPQAGTTNSGNAAPNLETRIYLAQVFYSYDPRFGHFDLWTAHTIAGGAGSEIRWYEINPNLNVLDQIGTVSDPTLYLYNATIVPDRIVVGIRSAFGSDAVVSFNTSSATTFTAVQITAKEGDLPMSAIQKVKQSSGPNVDFTCSEPYQNYCRWGDYSGSAPAPNSINNANKGDVWITNEWNNPQSNDNTPVWQTVDALITP